MVLSALRGAEPPVTGGIQKESLLSGANTDLISSLLRRIRLDALNSPCQL